MKIATVLGSPRRAGNTATVLGAFETAAAQHEIRRVNVIDYTIQGCRGCDACQKKVNIPGCRLHDDFEEVLNQLLASDLVIYAAPVYVWDFPAQMKALMERHYCLVKWKGQKNPVYLFENKRTALIATCGGAIRSNTDLIKEIYKREMDYLHCRALGTYFCSEGKTKKQMTHKATLLAARMIKELLK